jgi:hypothetical protein
LVPCDFYTSSWQLSLDINTHISVAVSYDGGYLKNSQ